MARMTRGQNVSPGLALFLSAHHAPFALDVELHQGEGEKVARFLVDSLFAPGSGGQASCYRGSGSRRYIIGPSLQVEGVHCELRVSWTVCGVPSTRARPTIWLLGRWILRLESLPKFHLRAPRSELIAARLAV